jgi:SAM-dependent methyltransferase
MDRRLCEQVPLVCPACRARLDDEGSGTTPGPGLTVASADATGSHGELIHGTLACPRAGGCGREYPVLDGIPILVVDLDTYLRDERETILHRRDLPAWARELLDLSLDDADARRRRTRALAAYAATYPAPPHPLLASLAEGLPAFLQKCLAAHGPSPRAGAIRRGLDAGCATGGFTGLLARHVDLAIGIDLAFDRVRHAHEATATSPVTGPRPSFVVASADEPAFDADTFDAVLAVNLLDAIRDPRRLLRALDRSLRPGGLLVLTTPFEYGTEVTELEDRVEEDELLETLAPGYEVVEDADDVPWHLPASERHHDVYLVRAIAARKRERGAGSAREAVP